MNNHNPSDVGSINLEVTLLMESQWDMAKEYEAARSSSGAHARYTFVLIYTDRTSKAQ